MGSTLHKPASTVLDTAFFLASSGIFSLGTPFRKSTLGPLSRVGGLTVFQRTIFSLQRGGISHIWILAGEEERTLRSLVHDDHRMRASLRWLPIREFSPTDSQTWETLADEVKGSCFIVGCHTIFSPSLIQSLRKEAGDGRVWIVIGKNREGNFPGNPAIALPNGIGRKQANPSLVFHDQHFKAPPKSLTMTRLPVAGDLIVMPARLLGISGILHAQGTNPIRLALEQAAIERTIKTVEPQSHQFWDIRGPQGIRLAEQTLLKSLQPMRGELDGIVDRHLNRKLSGFLTRFFLKVRMGPNAITLLAMTTGAIAGALFSVGTYELGILASLMFQLSVIIDCCDGEVARLTFSESRFGRKLDLWADNVVHTLIFAGIALGTYNLGPWQGEALPLILGTLTIIANLISFTLVNRFKSLESNPSAFHPLPRQDRQRTESMISNMANRDFSLVVLLFACFNGLGWFLGIAAIGSWLFTASLGWTLRRGLFPRG